jgi:D-xylose 1-dehydrogenase (NADP+, D-xylono-1,5-lactone-forming)
MTTTQPFNLGIMSTARIGVSAVLPALKKLEGVQATAVASRNLQKAQAYALEHQIPTAYGSYQELLDDPTLEGVYIPLPNSEHLEWAVKAMQAGKHVLCEKPLTLNAAEAQKLVEVSAQTGKVLLEAFMWRFHPQLAKVQALLPELGDLQYLSSSFSFPLSDPSDIRWNPQLGGGALYDVGTYTVCAARTLFAEEPVAVQAWGSFTEQDVDHTLLGVLHFSGERRATIDCSFSLPFRQRLELVGDKGQMVLGNPFATGYLGDTPPLVLHNGEAVDMPTQQDVFAHLIRHFVDAARGLVPLRYPPSEGLAQMKVLDALYTSARAGGIRVEV